VLILLQPCNDLPWCHFEGPSAKKADPAIRLGRCSTWAAGGGDVSADQNVKEIGPRRKRIRP